MTNTQLPAKLKFLHKIIDKFFHVLKLYFFQYKLTSSDSLFTFLESPVLPFSFCASLLGFLLMGVNMSLSESESSPPNRDLQ